jgi:3-hydroxy-9,10-secoandrosta-1,3,5(10)-triene-9,17-dione monooxygenase reductase component
MTGSAPRERDTFARLPAGVSLVTTCGEGGPYGMTASAVCCLSLEPPLVLVCLANRSTTLRRVHRHRRFAVNVLRDRHTHIADEFARPATDKPRRFASMAHRIVNDVPVLDDALAWLTCRIEATYPGGDHTIVVGRICARGPGVGEPLVWHDRRYRTLGHPDRAGGGSR